MTTLQHPFCTPASRRGTRHALSALLAAGAMLAGLPAAHAAALDCNNVRFVSPYPPGGTTDILARLLAPSMQQTLGVPIVVDNKPGASSNIGTEFVARAKPDGCTILLGNNTGIVINRNLYSLRIDPVKDLAPVAYVAAVPLVLYVNPKVEVSNVAELTEQVRKEPTKYSFASGGSGSPQHLAGELLKIRADIDMLHVPYKGQGPAMMDVIGGQIPIAFETTATLLNQARGGLVKPLATTGAQRAAAFPELPTMIESGFPGFEITNWYGVFAPSGVPQAIVDALNQAVNTALAQPDVAAKLADMGSAKVSGSAAEFARFIDAEVPRWEEVVKRSNAKLD